MSAGQTSILWSAEPHTIAKIDMLRAYLVAWFQILGRTRRGQDLLYVDGFAGPGEYSNYADGSPVAALKAAVAARTSSGESWVAGRIHCAFIEENGRRFENLEQKVASFRETPGLTIHEYKDKFATGIVRLISDVPSPFKGRSPLFVFIDPFGATGVPFKVVAELLTSSCSEVLINLDSDGIARIFAAGEGAAHESHLAEIFGSNEWKNVLVSSDSFDLQCRRVLQLYKANLRNLPNVRYVFSFEMRTSSNVLNYHLVFGSQHWLGLDKMKEAMKTIDQTGAYCFSDADVNQAKMFRFDNPEEYSLSMYKVFNGRKATYDELRDYALNETPFRNPKSMLKDLECNRDLIDEVKSSDPKRRRGTFNEKCLGFIKFR